MKSVLLLLLAASSLASVLCDQNSSMPQNGEIGSRSFDVGFSIHGSVSNKGPTKQNGKKSGPQKKKARGKRAKSSKDDSSSSGSSDDSSSREKNTRRPVQISTTKRPTTTDRPITTTLVFNGTTPEVFDDAVFGEQNITNVANLTGQDRSPFNVTAFDSVTNRTDSNTLPGTNSATVVLAADNNSNSTSVTTEVDEHNNHSGKKPNKPGKKPKKDKKKPNKKPNVINVTFNNNGQNTSSSFIYNQRAQKKLVNKQAMWVGNL